MEAKYGKVLSKEKISHMEYLPSRNNESIVRPQVNKYFP